MGSGSLAAMSVFETAWRPKLNQEQAVKLCSEAIQAGIFNDLGSGSNVDVAIITPEKTTLRRNYVKPNERSAKLKSYAFQPGTTAVLNEKVIRREDIGNFVSIHALPSGEAETMELDT